MRNEILSLDEVRHVIEVAEQASFLDRAPVIESSSGRAPIPVEVGS
jgi:hypothetical protein